jgi:hypothetical protein
MDLNYIINFFKNGLKSKWLLSFIYLLFAIFISINNDDTSIYFQNLYNNLFFRLFILISIFILTHYDHKLGIIISLGFVYILINLNEKRTNIIINHLSKYVDNDNNLTYLNYENFDNYNNNDNNKEAFNNNYDLNY